MSIKTPVGGPEVWLVFLVVALAVVIGAIGYSIARDGFPLAAVDTEVRPPALLQQPRPAPPPLPTPRPLGQAAAALQDPPVKPLPPTGLD